MQRHDHANEVWITGIGLVSSLGEGVEAHANVMTGRRPCVPSVDEATFAPYPVHPSNAARLLALMDRASVSIIVDHLDVARGWSDAMTRAGRAIVSVVRRPFASHIAAPSCSFSRGVAR